MYRYYVHVFFKNKYRKHLFKKLVKERINNNILKKIIIKPKIINENLLEK